MAPANTEGGGKSTGEIPVATLPAGWSVRRRIALPAVVRNSVLRLSFGPDAAQGARLLAVEQVDEAEGAFAFSMVSGGTDEGAGSRLWSMRCTLRGTGEEVMVDPGASRAAFEARRLIGPERSRGILFHWEGVRIPGAEEGDELDVALAVLLPRDEVLSRWWVSVRRRKGESASVDWIEAPSVAVRGPVAPREGEQHAWAQRRARVLVPQNIVRAPFFAQNSPLGLWMLARVRHRFVHPGNQMCQFAALCATDPQDRASFRRVLYLGTEDPTGHYKEFVYQGQVGSGEVGRMELGVRHYPPFAAGSAEEGGVVRTEFGNEHQPRYPATLGALRARTDAWWYDAAALYRSFVERSGIGGPPRKRNARLSSLAGAAPFSAHIQIQHVAEGAILLDRFVHAALDIREALRNPHVPVEPSFMHWQSILTEGRGVLQPLHPVTADVEPDVRALVERAFRQGIRTSGYTYGLALANPHRTGVTGWERFLKESDQVHDRRHEPVDPEEFRLDFGSPRARRFFARHLHRDLIEAYRFSGFYMDSLAGVPIELAYDPPPLHRPTHVAHGGDYFMQGKVAAAQRSKDLVRRFGPGSTGEVDPEGFLMSEAATEYLAPHLDFVQEGLIFAPWHMLLAEEVAWRSSGVLLGAEDVPAEARNMSPPIWSAVYHEWSAAGRLEIPLTNNGLATNRRFYPRKPFRGMTAEEWTDLHVFLRCCTFLAGLKSLSAHFAENEPMFTVEQGRVVADRSVDPEETAVAIMAAVRTMFAALREDHAGQFLVYGRFERPLEVDYGDLEVVLLRNPAHASRKTDPRDRGNTYPQYSEAFDPANPLKPGWPWVSADFPVVQVLHSVWRNLEGRLGAHEVMVVAFDAEGG